MRRYQRRIGFGPLRFAWRSHQVPEDQKVGAVTGVSDQEMDLFTAAADFSSSAPVSIQESLACDQLRSLPATADRFSKNPGCLPRSVRVDDMRLSAAYD